MDADKESQQNEITDNQRKQIEEMCIKRSKNKLMLPHDYFNTSVPLYSKITEDKDHLDIWRNPV